MNLNCGNFKDRKNCALPVVSVTVFGYFTCNLLGNLHVEKALGLDRAERNSGVKNHKLYCSSRI